MAVSAQDIYQAQLDALTVALWDADADTVLANTTLPTRMTTPDTDIMIQNADEMRASLAELRRSLDRIGATAFHRICTAANFEGADRIRGRHTSYVLRGGSYALPPYDSDMLLVARGNAWRCAEIHSDVLNRHMTVIDPKLLQQRAAAAHD